MTEKESNIINSAINLFAQTGYDGTSTSIIAKNAGVSEGLIFKHFKNKNGLLEKLIEISKEKLKDMILPLQELTHPKVILKYILSIPLNIGQQEKKLFTVIYGVRWQINDKRMDLLKLFESKILESFKALNHNDPISETRTFLMILEGTLLYVLQNDPQDSLLILDNLLEKFNL